MFVHATRTRAAFTVLGVALLSVLASGCAGPAATAQPIGGDVASQASRRADEILDRISKQTSNEPDTLLLAARASLELGRTEDARSFLDRLAMVAIDSRNGHGWGLSYPWDAYQDGTVNPSSTIYSYTTAAAGLAFLDAYRMLGDSRYLAAAKTAAKTLLGPGLCCWKRKRYLAVWYSDQDADKRAGYQVHNVSGLTLALLSGLARVPGAPRHTDERDRLFRYLHDRQGEGLHDPAVSPGNWLYRPGDTTANDLIHEVFIDLGLLAHGTPASRADALRSLEGIWATHFAADGEPKRDRATLGSNGWGPPAALYILSGYRVSQTGRGELPRRSSATTSRTSARVARRGMRSG